MEKDSYLHELYLHHALNSNGISSWGEEFVRSPNAITSEQSLRRSVATSSQGGGSKSSETKRRCRWRVPVWLRWRRFWLTLAMILIMLGASLYNFFESQVAFQKELRESVRSLAEVKAEEISRQIQASTRSLLALEAAIKIDESGIVVKHFDLLAQSLIGSIMGITALGLAPSARLTKMYPPDKFAAVHGADILLHPVKGPPALEAILKRETYIDDDYQAVSSDSYGPSGSGDPPSGGPPSGLISGERPDFVARRPIFTTYAPTFMPDSWIIFNGQNHTRQCSGTDYPSAVPNCYFPGEADQMSGDATHFWGFAIMAITFQDLLRTISLEDLETGVHRVAVERGFQGAGYTKFSYQLCSGMPMNAEMKQRWPHSNSSLDADPEIAYINVPHLALHWTLAVAPVAGWEATDANSVMYMLLLLPLVVLISACLCMDVIIAMRKHSQQETWKLYMREVRARTIQSAISNLNVLQFPFCVVSLEDFESFGLILRYESIRDRGKLHAIDTAQSAREFCRLDGVVFISHQWAGYSHPDPYGIKYKAISTAIRDLQKQGVRANWLWLDYSCIPQENNIQQQSAINSMFAYTSFCTTFISMVPSCRHIDSGEDLTCATKQARLWCLLEQLCFSVSRAGMTDEMFQYTDESLTKDDPNPEEILGVISGTSTCCQLCHAGSSPCDKQRVVSVMLGIYWSLLVLKSKEAGMAGWAADLLEKVNAEESRFFPARMSLIDETGGEFVVELFEGYLIVLREMFDQDGGQDLNLGAPGVTDPCAFTGTTSCTVSKNLKFSRSNSQMSVGASESRRVSSQSRQMSLTVGSA